MAKQNNSIDEGRLVKIETTLDYVKESLGNNKGEHKAILDRLDLIDKVNEKRIKELIESNDKKYASKPSEWIAYGLVTILVTAVLYALLTGVTL